MTKKIARKTTATHTTTSDRSARRGNRTARGAVVDPVVAPGSPAQFRVRVRMYRHGLGDCFLLSFPRKGTTPFHMLIDCGVLARDAAFMTSIVEHIRDTALAGRTTGKARLDVVVATHEHKDHVSGFNQARAVFNDNFDFGAVWLGWTENLGKPEIKKIKDARRRTVANLQAALKTPLAGVAADALAGVESLLGFSQDDDSTGSGRVADAVEYLKLRGKDARNLKYLEPGTEPFALDGVPGVRVYVLGPPLDPILLKESEVTTQMKTSGMIYHLSKPGVAGMDVLSAALSSTPGASEDRYHPFSEEHRIGRETGDRHASDANRPSPYFGGIRQFVAGTYDNPDEEWRRIDHDWLRAVGQLALDLDNDTNNTSLVLAFEFESTRDVLLFVGDAQVGSWRSWADLEFKVPGREKPLPAHDLLGRTVFYKVGHHCSHNATLKKGGLELMNRDDLVAFIPLDRDTASHQGKNGWDMPARPLYQALQEKTKERVVISDTQSEVPPEIATAGVIATGTYIDYFLR